MAHRRFGPLHDFLVEFSVGVAGGLRHQNILARNLTIWAEFLDANGFLVNETRARGQILVFFLRKALDNFGLRE